MQNTIARERSHWRWIGRWSWATLGFNNGWLRRFTTFIMGIVILSLATVALADTTDYDVTTVSMTRGLESGALPYSFGGYTYDYVLNNGGAATVESGLNTSIKLTDGGFDGPLPGDLLPLDVVQVEMTMTAIKQGNSANEPYPVTVDMWVLDEPVTAIGGTSWVAFSPSTQYDAVGDTFTETVTIGIPDMPPIGKVEGKHYVSLDGAPLYCNAGSSPGPLNPDGLTTDATGWYDADGDGVGDYCYKVKVQGRPQEPGFGNGSGMVIYFNIDPPAGCAYTFGGFLSPMQGTAGSWYRSVRNANAAVTVKFQMYDGSELLSDDDAAKLVNGISASDDCELIMQWNHADVDASPPAPSSGDAMRQGQPVTTFVYDPGDLTDSSDGQFIFPLNITGSGMVAGHDYLLTVYLTDGSTTGVIDDGSTHDAAFLLHVAH